MNHPEFAYGSPGGDIAQKAERNVDRLIVALHKPTDVLTDTIRGQHPRSKLVSNALEDIELFYDERTYPPTGLDDVRVPLLLAYALPCEKPVSQTVTAIRLLSDAGNIPGFKINAYWNNVARGVKELATASDEPCTAYINRLRASDASAPHLKLVATSTKKMLIDILHPVSSVEASELVMARKEKITTAKLDIYQSVVPLVRTRNDRGLWQAMLQDGIARMRYRT
jgi:hypothetical protein